ncbi:hypothetical protein ACNIV1_25180, partial [Escherichia coli]
MLEVILSVLEFVTEGVEFCFVFMCLFFICKLTKMAPSKNQVEVVALFHCCLFQLAALSRTCRYITD